MTDAFKAAPNPSSGLRGISLISIVANTLILGERLRLDGNLTSLDSMSLGENLLQSIRLSMGIFRSVVFAKALASGYPASMCQASRHRGRWSVSRYSPRRS